MDGFSDHLLNYPDEFRFLPVEGEGATKEEIVAALNDSGTEILLNYMPVAQNRQPVSMPNVPLKQAVLY